MLVLGVSMGYSESRVERHYRQADDGKHGVQLEYGGYHLSAFGEALQRRLKGETSSNTSRAACSPDVVKARSKTRHTA